MPETKTITFKLDHDESFVPEKLSWAASDGVGVEDAEIAALLISVWDPKKGLSSRVDFWTKDMTKAEMKMFYAQTLMTMADSLDRATGEEELSEFIRGFGREFADRVGIQI